MSNSTGVTLALDDEELEALLRSALHAVANAVDTDELARPGFRPVSRGAWFAAAAALVAAVAGLTVVVRSGAGSNDATESPVVTDVRRSGGVVSPFIDLDRWLTGAPPWPTALEPVEVFDLARLPDGWTVVAPVSGYRPASNPRTGRWQATVADPAGAEYVLGGGFEQLPDGAVEPIGVGGRPGMVTANAVWWRTAAGDVVSVTGPDAEDRGEALGLARQLQLVEAAELDPAPASRTRPSPISDPEPVLAGSVAGHAWGLEVDERWQGMRLTVDGAPESSFTVASRPPAERYNVSVTGVAGGVVVFGFAPRSIRQVRVELSTGVTIEVGAVAGDEVAAYGVPIPTGLDVVALDFVAADDVAIHRLLLPPYPAGVQGSSVWDGVDFDDPRGVQLSAGG